MVASVTDVARVRAHTLRWLAEFVVGLDLCPFARPLLVADTLRIAVSEAESSESLRRVFLLELDLLQSTPEYEIASTLLVLPRSLEDFEHYLEFLDEARELLGEAGLDGLVQLASFHPRYLFCGESPESASHYSNRAPYPSIHLLREDMLSRVLADFPDPGAIPARNIATLTALGTEELATRWRGLFVDPDQTLAK